MLLMVLGVIVGHHVLIVLVVVLMVLVVVLVMLGGGGREGWGAVVVAGRGLCGSGVGAWWGGEGAPSQVRHWPALMDTSVRLAVICEVDKRAVRVCTLPH